MSLDVKLQCPCCKSAIFEKNITHNLGKMADVAGVYLPIWRPEEISVVMAFQLIGPLKSGVRVMQAEKEKLQKYNPKNGWGKYEDLLYFAKEYFKACCRHPHASVKVWR